MVLDLIRFQNFHSLTVTWVNMFVVFGVDMSSSVHIDNKKKNTLILGFGPKQG